MGFVFIFFSSPEPLAHCKLLGSCVVSRASSTIDSKDISQTTGWILTKLGRNDLYMAFFKNCSNGSNTLHI